MLATSKIPDGLDELRHAMPVMVELIAQTARWVHPDTFRALPVWCPETARKQPIYDAKWQRIYTNTGKATGRTAEKFEPNIRAGKAFARALGTRKRPNWTVCHIWGVDDAKFQKPNGVIQDPRYYSCVANMVWLPTPLKGFTDCSPEIRRMLRVCVFNLYGWVCEHPDVKQQANEVSAGTVPDGYPPSWPTPERKILPPGTVPFSSKIAASIAQRKSQLQKMLGDPTYKHFPREQVHRVLSFWKVEL